MPEGRRKRVAASGWREGTVQEFLGLSDEEATLIRTKAALAVCLQRRRKAKKWSQTVLAERIGSGQSRVAKVEAAHRSVSLELLVKALLATGATMADIGAVIATGTPDTKARVRRSTTKRVTRGRHVAAVR